MALAHVTRSEILNYLKDKDYVRAGQIAEDLGIANSTLSGHLKVMKSAGLNKKDSPFKFQITEKKLIDPSNTIGKSFN